METSSRVVIVGAGQAGGTAAATLRDAGFDGSVTLLGAEPHPPYERPPLSKAYLRGATGRADAYLAPEESWAARDVTLRTGTPVERIDRATGHLELAGGDRIGYDRLVLATGAAARPLEVPGADLDGVLTLRTFEDADLIRSLAHDARHVLVVGGGWIGSEVSASLRRIGVPVTVAISGSLLLETALGGTVAAVYDSLHRENGVTVLPRTRIAAFEGDGHVRRARTAAGRLVPADLVVVAVGARPRVDLARTAGLADSGAVVVDGLLRTEDPRILAAGDVARVPYPDLARALQFGHWGGAQAQGRHAARTILGSREPYAELPYFFSDQYDTGMEFWGDPAQPGDVVVRGSLAERSFTAFWHEGGRVRAALTMHVHHHHEDVLDGDHADSGDEPAVPQAPAATTHAGGHVDPELVGALIRGPRPVDVRALGDADVPLEELV